MVAVAILQGLDSSMQENLQQVLVCLKAAAAAAAYQATEASQMQEQ